MTVKPPSLDYEPLKRTTSDSVVDDGAESVFKKPGKFGDADDEWIGAPTSKPQKPALTSEEKRDEPSTPEPAKETWIHKHGHSLSFAGIFLFTALVFFRPYEFSPSLMWLSSAAFWIALATLIV